MDLRRLAFACALVGLIATGCRQTVVLDDLGPDAGLSGSGGKGKGGSNGTGGSFGTGGGPMDASTDGRCFNPQQIIATADRPLVLVALDRSSEMTTTTLSGSNNSQFDEAVTNLSAQVGNYAPSGQHANRRTVDFAYLAFPQGTCMTQGCCASTGSLTDSYSMFTAATTCDPSVTTCGPTTNHPLTAALSNASDFFEFGAGGSPANERYVLVVTDDFPSGNCSSPESDCQAAQDKVYALSSQLNVTTVVVLVGTPSNGNCSFQNFANAQGGSPPPYYGDSNLYYNATSAQDLMDKISRAIGAMAQGACRFTLYSTPSSPNNLSVSVGNSMPIQPDSKNGWTYDNGSSGPRIILHGSACTSSYLTSQFGLQVTDNCPPGHVSP